MKHASRLALLLALGVLLAGSLGGCQTVSGRGGCPCVEANCCSWDFYKPCDLIEGRVDRDCPSNCGCMACRQGVVTCFGTGPAVVPSASRIVPAPDAPAEAPDVEPAP